MNVGMVFAVIFAVVVVGLVLVFGMEQIINIFCFGSDAQAMSAIKNLENEVDNLYVLAEGASKRYDLGIPADAEFCFIDPSKADQANILKGWEPDPVFVSLIRENSYNIWYTSCSGKNGYKVPYLLPLAIEHAGPKNL